MPPPIPQLFYITHRDNLPSILEHGILSHQAILDKGLSFKAIYDSGIVSLRKDKRVPGAERSLWDFVPLDPSPGASRPPQQE